MDIDEYCLIEEQLSKMKIAPDNFKIDQIINLIYFLHALWINSSLLKEIEKPEVFGSITRLGRSILKIYGDILNSLTVVRMSLNDPYKTAEAEKILLSLFDALTSPGRFYEMAKKPNKACDKFDGTELVSILGKCNVQKMCIGKEEGKSITELMSLVQKNDVRVHGDLQFREKQVDILRCLLDLALKQIKLQDIWVSYLLSTLDVKNYFDSPCWTSDWSITGWSSYNTCIFICEKFGQIEGFSEQQKKIEEAFIFWARTALQSLSKLAAEKNIQSNELIGSIFGSYIFQIFVFLGYSSKDVSSTLPHEGKAINFPIILEGIELAASFLDSLMNIGNSKLLNIMTPQRLYSTIYYPLSYLCKQMSKLLLLKGSKELFSVLSKRNYLQYGVSIIVFLMSNTPQHMEDTKSIAGLNADKKEAASPAKEEKKMKQKATRGNAKSPVLPISPKKKDEPTDSSAAFKKSNTLMIKSIEEIVVLLVLYLIISIELFRKKQRRKHNKIFECFFQ